MSPKKIRFYKKANFVFNLAFITAILCFIFYSFFWNQSISQSFASTFDLNKRVDIEVKTRSQVRQEKNLEMWQEYSKGLPAGYEAQMPFEYDGQVYVVSHSAGSKEKTGLYKLNKQTETWEKVGKERGPSYEIVIDGQGNFYYAAKDNKKTVFFKLNKGYSQWQQIGEVNYEVTTSGVRKNVLIDDVFYTFAKDEKINKTIKAYNLKTKQVANIPFPSKTAGPHFYMIKDKNGNLLMSDHWGGRAYNNGKFKWDQGAVWRYNPKASKWEDITRNLDQRNSTDGKCCGGVGTNSEGIVSSLDAEHIYIRTEHGLWKWDYQNEDWDRLFDAPYGSGAGRIAHIGDKKVAFDSRYMENGKYRHLGTNRTQIKSQNPKYNDFKTYRTRIGRMTSFDNGETFYAQVTIQKKRDGTNDWSTEKTILAKMNQDKNQPATSFDFSPKYSTYIGGNLDDTAEIVEVTPTRDIVVAGIFTANMSQNPVTLLNTQSSQKGRVIKYDSTGKNVLAEVILGDKIFDMELNPKDQTVAVIGDFGVVVLDKHLTQVIWSKELDTSRVNNDNSPARVSIGRGGKVATLIGRQVTTWDKQGQQIATKQIPRTYATDLAIMEKYDSVFVSGFSNNKGTNSAGKTNPVQIAFVHAYKISDLQRKWKVWDYEANTLANTENMADTRIYRISKGKDHNLYVAGESAGGNTIFRWNGQDLKTSRLITTDPYNTAWNTASSHIGYIAKINPNNGYVNRGQMVLARLISNNKGNTWKARAITTDEEGNVYVGGVTACCTIARSIRKVGGQEIGDYKGGESNLLVLSPNFKTRRLWTPLISADSNKGDGGAVRSIAVGYGLKVLVGEADRGKIYTTTDANIKEPMNPEETQKDQPKIRDAYMVIWE